MDKTKRTSRARVKVVAKGIEETNRPGLTPLRANVGNRPSGPTALLNIKMHRRVWAAGNKKEEVASAVCIENMKA